ncbi:hypothetical protein VIGAN_UM013600, partial [Vigna angularis var. angularis]
PTTNFHYCFPLITTNSFHHPTTNFHYCFPLITTNSFHHSHLIPTKNLHFQHIPRKPADGNLCQFFLEVP